MSLPVNLDLYSRYVALDDDELREMRVAESLLVRLHRIRGMYAYWLQFPSKQDNDIVLYTMNMFKVSRSQAYDDLALVKVLLGNLQQTSKDFMRWKINKSLYKRYSNNLPQEADYEEIKEEDNATDDE